MTIILLLCAAAITGLAACAGQDATPVKIRFAVQGSTAGMLEDLRFYIHDIELLADQDRTAALRLSADNKWQSERVALLDLSGAERNDTVIGSIKSEAANFTGIRFALGVPFDLNHAKLLQASAPLNRGDLFWAWQSGYKFLRLDFRLPEREGEFHLGSTGCSSVSALRPPTQPCVQPNLLRVELRGFDPLTQSIQFNVDELIIALKSADKACTGDYSQSPACAAAFATTGLDPATGRCDGVCRTQRLFGVARE